MKTVVVTGASGFIGKSITKKFINEGKTVYAVVRDINKIADIKHYNGLIPIVANLNQYKNLYEVIQDKNVDAFYHFAWDGVFGEAFKDYRRQLDNAIFSCEALQSAIKMECKKFVFAGTVNEYEARDNIFRIGFEPRYTNIYSGSKLLTEVMCKTIAYNEGIQYSAGLIALAYGEENRSKMLPNIVIKKLLNNESPSLISGEKDYDLIYIDDIVNAFLAIGERGLDQRSYYVGHRNLQTFREIMTEIRDIINPGVELNFGGYKGTIELDYSNIDTNALFNDTGFECKADFEESIRNTAAWLKSIDFEID